MPIFSCCCVQTGCPFTTIVCRAILRASCVVKRYHGGAMELDCRQWQSVTVRWTNQSDPADSFRVRNYFPGGGYASQTQIIEGTPHNVLRSAGEVTAAAFEDATSEAYIRYNFSDGSEYFLVLQSPTTDDDMRGVLAVLGAQLNPNLISPDNAHHYFQFDGAGNVVGGALPTDGSSTDWAAGVLPLNGGWYNVEPAYFGTVPDLGPCIISPDSSGSVPHAGQETWAVYSSPGDGFDGTIPQLPYMFIDGGIPNTASGYIVALAPCYRGGIYVYSKLSIRTAYVRHIMAARLVSGGACNSVIDRTCPPVSSLNFGAPVNGMLLEYPPTGTGPNSWSRVQC